MCKILILTFSYVPYNVTGTFRIMRFVKYFPKFGLQPIIITADQGNHHINEKLTKNIPKDMEIIRIKSFFPDSQERSKKTTKYYKMEKTNKFYNKVVLLVKDAFLSPDVQITWCLRILPKIVKFIKKEKIRYLYITASPFSLLLLGALIKNIAKIKLIFDLRDPWSESHNLQYQTFLRKFHNHWMERYSILKADCIVATTRTIIKIIQEKCEIKIPYTIIPNGYDPDDYKLLKNNENDGIFTFCYTGSFDVNNNAYNPIMILKAIRNFNERYPQLNIRFKIIGRISAETMKVIKSLNLENIIILLNFQPHQKVLEHEKKSDVLIHFYYPKKLIETISIKVFEYSQMKKPIISINTKDAEVSSFLQKTNLGYSCENDDIDAISELFYKVYHLDMNSFRKNINVNEIEK